MENEIKKKIYPKNPLGIIALFVFFIEAISTVSLKFMIDGSSEFIGHLVWFIILYPSVIAFLFFITLWCKRESFYGPSDFKDDTSFVSLLHRFEKLEIRQEANQIDPKADIDDYMNIIKNLINKNDIYTAIQVGRSSLKEQMYDNSYKLFTYLADNCNRNHDLYSRILANLAYSLIGLGKFDEAINWLQEVYKIRGKNNFRVWHAVALAYSYFKIGYSDDFKTWLDFAKKQERVYSIRLPENLRLYPEIENDLRL